MAQAQKDYQKLRDLSHEARVLEGIHSLLDWDQETYMPPGAAGIRSEQFKVMAGVIHKLKTGRPFLSAMQKLIDLKSGKVEAKGLSVSQKAALREWRRDYSIEKALPQRFVEDFAKLTSQSIHVWRHARDQDAYQQFSPFLEKIVDMMRKKADLLGYKAHPYDALLDLYEPDISTKDVSILFGDLRSSLTKLLKKITVRKKADDSFLFGKFSTDQQIKFGKLLLEAMHYDMNYGRLDLSAHPFSAASHPTDSRITTRIQDSLMSNISAVMHEAGHALYEMGLPVEEYGTPLGQAISLGMHESQSRWWETRIGLSKPFWKYFLPLLKKHFKHLENISLDAFYKAINVVSPSLIRVEADEVTYSLHVILRFELEKALIEGKLAVRDIPEAWNAKMKELLGIVPQSNREGCLQDIHWSMGAFGYFPTYTLGNLYGAHLFTGFAHDHSDWQKKVEGGDLLFIKTWLNENVHRYGRQYSSKELLKKVTGKAFSAEAYTHYLNEKYSNIIK